MVLAIKLDKMTILISGENKVIYVSDFTDGKDKPKLCSTVEHLRWIAENGDGTLKARKQRHCHGEHAQSLVGGEKFLV